MKLVAIKTFSYDGKRLAVGEIFDTRTDSDGILLVGVKNARLVDDRPEVKLSSPPQRLIDKVNEKRPEVKPETIEVKTEIKPEDKPLGKESTRVKPIIQNPKRTYNRRK